ALCPKQTFKIVRGQFAFQKTDELLQRLGEVLRCGGRQPRGQRMLLVTWQLAQGHAELRPLALYPDQRLQTLPVSEWIAGLHVAAKLAMQVRESNRPNRARQ